MDESTTNVTPTCDPWIVKGSTFSFFLAYLAFRSHRRLFKKLKGVIFYLLANPAEIAYLSVRDGELSNAVRLVEYWQRKVAVHTFLGVVPSGAAQTVFVPEIS